MQRYFLISFLVLLAPIVVFVIWRMLSPRAGVRTTQVLDVLLLIGAVVLVGLLFAYNLYVRPDDGGARDDVWVPPYITAEGELVDGFFFPGDAFTSRAAARAAQGLPPAAEDAPTSADAQVAGEPAVTPDDDR